MAAKTETVYNGLNTLFPWTLHISHLYIVWVPGCSWKIVYIGYTLLNHKRNEEILEELHVTPLEGKLCTYRHKWFQHVHRMEDNRLPKQLVNYHPKGRRRPGRPRKRLLDDTIAETETGHPGLNSWWNMMVMMKINITINDLERIWKEAAMAYFKVQSQHTSGGPEESQGNPSRYSVSARNFNQRHLK
jgi:hypothetical protein